MGWWSPDILGGDGPLDVLAHYANALNLESLYPLENWTNDTRRNVFHFIRHNSIELWGLIEDAKYLADTPEIATQVFGAMWLASGALMDRSSKLAFLEAAAGDQWAKEDEGRKVIMNDFIRTIEDYDGTPTFVEHRGLLETIFTGESNETD